MAGCQKENLTTDSSALKDEVVIEKFKTFYDTKLEKNGQAVFEGEPLWGKLTSSVTDASYLIPVKLPSNVRTEKKNLVKYLMITGTGEDLSGEFVYAFEKEGLA